MLFKTREFVLDCVWLALWKEHLVQFASSSETERTSLETEFRIFLPVPRRYVHDW